jgi:hypothetical protein
MLQSKWLMVVVVLLCSPCVFGSSITRSPSLMSGFGSMLHASAAGHLANGHRDRVQAADLPICDGGACDWEVRVCARHGVRECVCMSM